jgi:hypothetical protein
MLVPSPSTAAVACAVCAAAAAVACAVCATGFLKIAAHSDRYTSESAIDTGIPSMQSRKTSRLYRHTKHKYLAGLPVRFYRHTKHVEQEDIKYLAAALSA